MSLSIDDIQNENAGAHITILAVLEDEGVEQLTRALAEVGCKWIVVLYDPGPIAVAQALARNIPPSTSLVAWKGRARLLLSAYRSNRNRMVFASAAGVRAGPKEFRSSLLEHFNLSGEIGVIGVPSAAADWSAWQLVFASQAVAADAKAVFLDRELEAAALPLVPVSSDIEKALTELQAAASIRDLLIRQLSKLRQEVSQYFLSAAANASPALVVEKKDELARSANAQSNNFIQTLDVKPRKSAANMKPPTSTIGRLVMNEYLPIETSDYRHFDISVYDVQDGGTNWKHIRFKFCSCRGHEYIEFRSGPDFPIMFRAWPGRKEDQFGPYLNYPDSVIEEGSNISDPRDLMLLRLVFNILEKVLDAALREASLDEAERLAWLDKANRFVTNQREVMAAWDAGEKGSAVTTAE